MNTPAFTTATACSSAETGVGATMRGRQPAMQRHHRRLGGTEDEHAEHHRHGERLQAAGEDAAGRKSVVPATAMAQTMAGSSSTIDAPISVSR